MEDKTFLERPSFGEAVRFWFKLGWISFGGTAGHIAIMHDFLVDKKKWISNSRFFHALSFCMLLPGPEAQQLAIYIGWKLHGRKGGLVAGTLFVLPSMLVLLALSIAYVLYGNLPWITALFNGLKPAVIAIIVVALYKVGQKALRGPLHFVVAAVSFGLIFFYNVPLLTIIGGAAVLALLVHWGRPGLLQVAGHSDHADPPLADDTGFGVKTFVREVVIFVVCWSIPFLGFCFFAQDLSFWRSLILFFTQTAFFTIGGSYTVLPYVAQFAVAKLNWLSKPQMIDGFALAETTPGPLIIVVAFVGFMAGFHHFNGSIAMGSLALVTTTFYTFLPCFLFIFAGGGIIEKTHDNPIAGHVLGIVTAAVVGVILNLTLFLGKDVVFPGGGVMRHLDLFSLGWIVVCLVLILRFKLNVVYLILLSLGFGLCRYYLG